MSLSKYQQDRIRVRAVFEYFHEECNYCIVEVILELLFSMTKNKVLNDIWYWRVSWRDVPASIGAVSQRINVLHQKIRGDLERPWVIPLSKETVRRNKTKSTRCQTNEDGDVLKPIKKRRGAGSGK